jgi:phosphocarrier protein FPr/phosphocarrier protein
MTDVSLLSPLSGWAAPLDEVDDEVFASRMLGDGLAIDPTEGMLRAPCDGEVTALPESAHAVTLRAANGAEILMHVGIDTVALKGAGFHAQARPGQRVKAGDPLIRFDLDRLAQGARSLVTPILVTEPERFRIVERRAPGAVRAGDVLMSLQADDAATAAPRRAAAAGGEAAGSLRIELAHGLHARPAALLAQALKPLRAEATLELRGRSANARSAVALISLGARHGDVLALRATGADATLVQGKLQAALASAAVERRAAEARQDAVAPDAGPAAADAGLVVASTGVAIGASVRMIRSAPEVREQGEGAAIETQRLDEARARLAAKFERLARAEGALGAGIVGAHLEFLEDPELLAAAYRGIGQGQSAGHAWRAAVEESVRLLGSLADRHLAARADDLRDLELQLLEILGGASGPAAAELPARAILLARDLLPSQFMALDLSRVAGIGTVSRAATSHVAILAGARGIPMIAGIDPALLQVADGTMILLDAERGRVLVAPGAAEVAEAEARIAERARLRARLLTAAALDCRTADGERIEVYANVGSAAEAEAAVAAGAEGCGLLRTEFLFLDRGEPPDLAEQLRQYQAIVHAFAGRQVVVRTLDAGSDKPMPFLAMPAQDNPALGLRGIRASLWRPELLRAQLAAILSVRPAGRCRILLPMVNDAGEVEAVRAILRDVAPGARGNADIPVGVMIETPAAAVGAARLAAHADFFSIGTNDLAQYVLAIDRTHPLLAGQLDALHPAVLKLIGSVCTAARAAGRPVAVCGSLASEPAAAPLLVGLGVGELSAVPGAIPAVKDAVRRRTLADCRALAERALAAADAAAVRALLQGRAGEAAP